MGFFRNLGDRLSFSSGASAQGRAAREAAQLQAQSAQSALEYQKASDQIMLDILSPYVDTGTNALDRAYLSAFSGINTQGLPEAQLAPILQGPAQPPTYGIMPVPPPKQGGADIPRTIMPVMGPSAGPGMMGIMGGSLEKGTFPTAAPPMQTGTAPIQTGAQPSLPSGVSLGQLNPAQRLQTGIGFGRTIPTMPPTTPTTQVPGITLPGAQLGQVGPLPEIPMQQGQLPNLAISPALQTQGPSNLPELQYQVNQGLPGLSIQGPNLPSLSTQGPTNLPDIALSQMQNAPSVLPGDVGQDSLFQALKREAVGAIESSAAARGKLMSGTTPQAIAEKVQNLALARAGDIQQQNLAARQQMAAEQGQRFGETLGARQQLGAEAQAQFQREAAARGMSTEEFQAQFGRELAARGLLGSEQQQAFGQTLAGRQQLTAEQQALFGRQLSAGEQAFGQSLAARQLLGGEQQDAFTRALAARQALIGERGALFGQDLSARQAAIEERGTLYQQALAARQAALGERTMEQEQRYNQMFNLAQLGQAAAAGQAANVQASAGNVGALLTQQGNALAAGIMGPANARAQANQALMSGLFGLGGAGIGAFFGR